MKKIKVLVLGNGPQINDIDFDRLDPSIITLGVNRIWLKHLPDYFFFNDPEIIYELNKKPEILAKLQTESKIFTSDYFLRFKRNIPKWAEVVKRSPSIRRTFPDSVTTGMTILRSKYLVQDDVQFYLAGVSLKWKTPSHFWKQLEYNSINKHTADWYAPRFKKIYENFKIMQRAGTNMISVNPDSLLNKMLRYESIDTLYLK